MRFDRKVRLFCSTLTIFQMVSMYYLAISELLKEEKSGQDFPVPAESIVLLKFSCLNQAD